MTSAFEKEFADAKILTPAPAELCKSLTQRLKSYFGDKAVLGLTPSSDAVAAFVTTAVAAFFDQDLLRATQMLLSNAKGSFGLFVSCSLDAHRQVVLAARGQTMSIGFYPAQNLVLWASEQVRVRVAPHTPHPLPTCQVSRSRGARGAGRCQGRHHAGRQPGGLLGKIRCPLPPTTPPTLPIRARAPIGRRRTGGRGG